MSWLTLVAVALVTIAVLLVIGVALARIIGLRSFTAIAVAPAFTMTVIAIASIVMPWLHTVSYTHLTLPTNREV